MKTQLIFLENPIIVSDEEIKEGDWLINLKSKDFEPFIKDFKYDSNDVWYRKIIAGIPELPSIDFSLLSKADCKKIGWVDFDKLLDVFEEQVHSLEQTSWEDIQIIKKSLLIGFKKAQSLNDKKFSLEDMYEFQKFVDRTKPSYKKQQEFIQSLSQPKVFDIEIEMKRERLYTNDGLDYEGDLNPKITNNQIKIIKVL